jgi:hypothetical protein
MRTLGAQTVDADTHLAFLQGVNYDVHGRVGFVFSARLSPSFFFGKRRFFLRFILRVRCKIGCMLYKSNRSALLRRRHRQYNWSINKRKRNREAENDPFFEKFSFFIKKSPAA